MATNDYSRKWVCLRCGEVVVNSEEPSPRLQLWKMFNRVKTRCFQIAINKGQEVCFKKDGTADYLHHQWVETK